jgi:cytochrome b561
METCPCGGASYETCCGPLHRDLARGFMNAHEAGVKLLYLLLILHVGAALKHHFIDRDNILHRMIPLIPRRP